MSQMSSEEKSHIKSPNVMVFFNFHGREIADGIKIVLPKG